jgi:hypothetical protein
MNVEQGKQQSGNGRARQSLHYDDGTREHARNRQEYKFNLNEALDLNHPRRLPAPLM